MRGKGELSSVEGHLGIIIDRGGFAGIDQAKCEGGMLEIKHAQ